MLILPHKKNRRCATDSQRINSAVSRKLIANTPSIPTPEMKIRLCILDCCTLPSPLIDPMNHGGGDMQHGGGNMCHRGSYIGSVSTHWTKVTLLKTS